MNAISLSCMLLMILILVFFRFGELFYSIQQNSSHIKLTPVYFKPAMNSNLKQPKKIQRSSYYIINDTLIYLFPNLTFMEIVNDEEIIARDFADPMELEGDPIDYGFDCDSVEFKRTQNEITTSKFGCTNPDVLIVYSVLMSTEGFTHFQIEQKQGVSMIILVDDGDEEKLNTESHFKTYFPSEQQKELLRRYRLYYDPVPVIACNRKQISHTTAR